MARGSSCSTGKAVAKLHPLPANPMRDANSGSIEFPAPNHRCTPAADHALHGAGGECLGCGAAGCSRLLHAARDCDAAHAGGTHSRGSLLLLHGSTCALLAHAHCAGHLCLLIGACLMQGNAAAGHLPRSGKRYRASIARDKGGGRRVLAKEMGADHHPGHRFLHCCSLLRQ